MGLRRFIVFAVVSLLAASAFGANRAPAAGDKLPTFILNDQRGRLQRAETLYADRPLVLSFFATNCGPCKRELPFLQKIHAARGERVRIVVVALDPEGHRAFAPYGKEHGITFTVLDGSGGALQDTLGIDSLPRVMLVDRKGIIKEILVGFDPAKEGELEAKILGLAGATP